MRLSLVFCCLIWGMTLTAQDVQFLRQHKDFGKIKEGDGLVVHRFEFKNKGGVRVRIDSVGSSCGCTVTEWSAADVAAGQNGYVEVKFDPRNRPGPFNKSITVLFKDKPQPYFLTVAGFVTPKPQNIEQEYPWSHGSLRLKNRFLNLGNIPNRGLASKSFEVYNQGDKILVFSDEMQGPNHITITFEPYTLKPKSRGKLWVHYDVAAKGDLGYYREDVSIFTYEAQQARKDLVTSVTIMDLPSNNGTTAPDINISPRIRDFGIKQQGDSVRLEYTISNTGKDQLKINKAFSSCNCVQLQLKDKQVAPGKTTTLEVLFLTHQRLGNQQKHITVFSNDPNQPVTVLTLKGLLRGPRD